jgi:hypothetical protein
MDDTIPQSTEGDQYMTQAITPSSAANLLAVTSKANLAFSVANSQVFQAVFQDATANALRVTGAVQVGNTYVSLITTFKLLAAGTAATTFKTRAGSPTVGTTTFNGRVATREFAGVHDSHLEAQEIMA